MTYRRFREASNQAMRIANPEDLQLARFATDTVLAGTRSYLIELNQQGIVFKGAPVSNPQVDRVDLSNPEVPSVEFSDCVDSTNWRPVYAATGKSAAAPNQEMRVGVTGVAQQWRGTWFVVRMTPDRSRPC